MRRLCAARESRVSRGRRHRAGRGIRRHTLLSSDRAGSALNCEIELSILSPPQPIAADAVEIGRHGLLISMAGRRGLLLPQVPVEHNWDRTTFLEQTCRKAGLPLDAWKNGATIEAFTAEVFGDQPAQD